ncbi:uncharacterized protein LOC143230250 isoform X2 [Tachypleus tridentatus]|uniref:uncharacterized protein LOC143230250 isoform X2 n=1 Tax=Tachypleus tridentatus TaxID=6853 RepID=UPI003FD63178
MFPKAKNKRFNEEYGCAPPVGYYNPNDKHKIRGVALDKMERPACVLPCDGINSDVSVSSSSSLSNGSMRSAKLCRTPFKTPFHIKSCVSSTPGLNKLTRDRFFSEPNEGSQVEKKLLESISSLEKERKDYLLQLDNYKTKVVELETELAIRGREVNEKDLQVSDYQGKLEETDQKVHNLHCEVLHLKQILCVSSSDVSASETNQLLQEYTTCHKEKVEEMETEVTDVRTELSEKELLTTDLLKLKATLLNGVEGCTEKLGILKGDIQELNDLVTHNNHYSSVENVGTYSTNQLENLASKVLSVEPHKAKKLWEEVNQKLSSCSTEGELEIERSEGCKRVQNKEGIEIQKIMNNPVEKMLSLEKEMKQLHLYIVKYLDLKNSEVCAVKSENSSLKKDLTEVIEQLTTYQSLIEESTTSSQKIELKYLENGKESLNVQENTELQINQFKLSLDEKDAQLEASKSKLTKLESTIRTLEASLDEKDTQLEASKSKFTELESSIRTLEASLDEKDTQLEATKSKLNELESSVGTLEASLEEKDTQLEASKSKLTELESTIRTLEASLDEKDTQLEATKSKLTEVESSVGTLEALLDKKDTQLEASKSKLTELESTIRTLEASLDEKDTQLEATKSKLTEVESSVGTLEALLDKRDTQLEASKSKFTELESSIRTLEASLDEKDTQLEATKSKLNELESSVGTLEASLEEKDTQLEASKSKLTELESTIRTLEASLDEKDTQLEVTKSKLTEVESSVGTLEALLDKIDTQLEASKSKLTELESSVGTLEELCRKFNDEKCQIKNLKTERSVLENQLKEIQETVVILETAAHEKDDYLNNKTSEVIELKKEKSELEKRLVTVKTEIEYLQTMLEENVAKISERDLKISQLQNEKYCLIEWIKIAENKTNDVLSCLEDKNRCIKNLRMELLEEQETKLKLKRQLECVNEEQKNQKYLTDGKDEIIQKLSSKVLSIYNETEQVGSQLTSLDLEIERKAYISSQEKDSSISPLTSEKVLEGKLENLEKELFHSLHQKNVSVSLVESENICLEESSEQVEKEIDEIKLQNKECLVQKSNEISKLESDKMIIEKALDMIRQQFHNLQFELQKQNNLITIRNSQLSCLETEKSNLQSQLAHYEEKFKNQDNILNEKEEDISAKNAKIETLDNKLEILVQETKSCRLEKQSAIEELARIQEKAKESDRIIEELTEKNNNTEDQVIKLSNEVGHLQERMIEFIFENELEQTKSDQRLLEELLRNEEFEKSMRADVEEIQRHNNKQKNDLLRYQEETEREIFELHIQVNFYEEKLKFLEDLRSSMNVETEKIEDLERELNKWKNLYLDLQEKVNPFKEQLDAFQAERQLLLNQNTEVHSELVNLSKQYAYLLGHQNHKQKIKHIMKIKQENMDFRQVITVCKSSLICKITPICLVNQCIQRVSILNQNNVLSSQ